MAPRGLSAEEKRVTLVEIFHEKRVSQSLKEVLQSLVDDNLIETDKIGSSNSFWSFPSQRGAIMQNRLDAAREARAASERQLAEVQAAIVAERATRPEIDQRTAALARLAATTKELAELQTELDAAAVLTREAALRHTDNYSVLMTHSTRQHGVEPQDIHTYLG
ncbi:meiotic nuclear division protein 1, partial [Lactarius tabidus]